MKISYYPGCTLKTKAQNLDETVVASLQALDIEYSELERWNCCGAAFSLADDNLLSLLAPMRNLVRVKEAGSDTVITACSLCYNSLARVNVVIREDEEKRDTLNNFMEEEIDYNGEVEVLHILNFLKDHYGWDKLRERVKTPLEGLTVAPYYGCLLMRPREIAIDKREYPQIFEEFFTTLGAKVINFQASHDCCGSYQIVSNPEVSEENCAKIIDSAASRGADILVSSCPLCEYNLGTKQDAMIEKHAELKKMPTYYFTQLLALALGLSPEICHFELNMSGALDFLKERNLVSV